MGPLRWRAGEIEVAWTDATQERRRVAPEVEAALRRAMRGELGRAEGSRPPVRVARPGEPLPAPEHLRLEDGTDLGRVARLPPDLPTGYHGFLDEGGERLLLVPPSRCTPPGAAQAWGWAVQLHALDSAGSWGIGDYADLRELASWSRESGAGLALVSPSWAANPEPDPEPSPYAPTTRRFHDLLYLRPDELPGWDASHAACSRAARAARALNAAALIDRAAVRRLKLEALHCVWEAGARERAREAAGLAAYRQARGRSLRAWAAFTILTERFGAGWRRWPEAYRSPASREVADLVSAEADRVAFHEWVQWQLDEQLAAAGRRLPLVNDLPIGFDAGGFDAWSWQDELAEGVSIGVPPDVFNTRGQDWGLPAFDPLSLRRVGYAPLIETFRAAMRHAGGLRIDHVMGLFRLWWVPSGNDPTDGGYVRYPADELLAVLAIESERAAAFVIGEDLGTVEPGVRSVLRRRGILSTRLVYFERDPPDRYPHVVQAAVTTHDLPTIAGCWHRTDLHDQRAAGLDPDPQSLERLRRRLARVAAVGGDADLDEVIIGAHRALAASAAAVVTATLEDALRIERRPNMPGTTRERRDNWSQRLPRSLEELREDRFVRRLGGALRR